MFDHHFSAHSPSILVSHLLISLFWFGVFIILYLGLMLDSILQDFHLPILKSLSFLTWWMRVCRGQWSHEAWSCSFGLDIRSLWWHAPILLLSTICMPLARLCFPYFLDTCVLIVFIFSYRSCLRNILHPKGLELRYPLMMLIMCLPSILSHTRSVMHDFLIVVFLSRGILIRMSSMRLV